MAEQFRDTITIKFKPEGDKQLLTAIKALNKETKSLVKSQGTLHGTTSGVSSAQKKMNKNTLLGVRNLRNMGVSTIKTSVAFSVLRSKLLLASFAISMFGATIGRVMKAMSKQEDAEKKLTQAIKSTGNATGITSLTMKNFASDLQAVTKFGDETIISAQALMLTFTQIGRDTFPEAIQASLNLSEAMGQDLQQTVIQIGKALNDPIQGMSALRRVGIQLSEQQQNQVKDFVNMNDVASAQKVILEELETQFGGMAVSATQTATGALIQLKNSWGDLLEMIGEKIAPTLDTVVQSLSNITLAMMSEREQEIAILQKLGFSEEFINQRRIIMFQETMRNLQDEGVARLANWGTVNEGVTSLQSLEFEYGNLIKLQKANQETIQGDEKAIKSLGDQYGLTRADMEFMIQTATMLDKSLAEQAAHIMGSPIKSIISLTETMTALNNAEFKSIVQHRQSSETITEQQEKYKEFMVVLRAYLELMGHEFPAAQNEAIQLSIKLSQVMELAMQSLGKALDPESNVGEAFKDFVINIMTAMQGVILASGQMAKAITLAFSPAGIGQAIASLIALEVAKAGVRNIKFAEHGFEGFVDKPTLFMTGEGNKREHVQITPVDRPEDRALGSGMTINFNNAVMSEDFTRDQIIPQIKKAVRLNLA
jgi:hypothetical protein|tara:strand:- start:30 stop:1988 length:1959 start_codon:yes stop_codon:yes gene_type:complete